MDGVEADPIPCSPLGRCFVTDPAPDCSCIQYFNEATSECVDCTRCCSNSSYQLSACLINSDTRCSPCDHSHQFYNKVTSSCQNCSVCSRDELEVSECAPEVDTVCKPRCKPHQYYSEDGGRCFFNCELCQHRCIEASSEATHCQCVPAQCYSSTDLLCQNNLCSRTESTTEEATGTVENKSNNLPAWGIGLISIGVVIGIVAFSAGSMVLSFCTRKTPHASSESEPGVNSKPDINGRYQPSARLHPHLFEKGGKYGYYPPGSLTRTGSLRGGGGGMVGGGGVGGRGGSIRGISKPPSNIQLTRSENATPI